MFSLDEVNMEVLESESSLKVETRDAFSYVLVLPCGTEFRQESLPVEIQFIRRHEDAFR